MNADKPILFNPRSSAFISGLICGAGFATQRIATTELASSENSRLAAPFGVRFLQQARRHLDRRWPHFHLHGRSASDQVASFRTFVPQAFLPHPTGRAPAPSGPGPRPRNWLRSANFNCWSVPAPRPCPPSFNSLEFTTAPSFFASPL